jgi:hypothetical protein
MTATVRCAAGRVQEQGTSWCAYTQHCHLAAHRQQLIAGRSMAATAPHRQRRQGSTHTELTGRQQTAAALLWQPRVAVYRQQHNCLAQRRKQQL